MIAFVTSPRFVEHQTGAWHPERPDRIRAICRAVRLAGMVNSPDPFPGFEFDLGDIDGKGIKLLEIEPRPATEEDVLRVHTPSHLDRVREVCETGGMLDQGDTPVEPGSFEIAMLSAGAVLQACDAVMAGTARSAFVAARPPGHHAEPQRAMGFCIFSNLAIGAQYLRQVHGIERIAIVDFDVHHGNGTQAAFEGDSGVYFVSMHQHPRTCYPGSGFDWEIGVGRGRGFTMNLPFMPGAGDQHYLQTLRNQVLPALDAFAPQVLMISAGFDAHMDDPLANIELTEDGFFEMTRDLARLADRHCAGRVISVLEGGYHLRALARSVIKHLVGLAADQTSPPRPPA